MGKSRMMAVIWAVAALAFAWGCVRVAYFTPEEATMKVIQKVFYIHMPTAINALLACFLVFIGSIGFLVQRRAWWDDLASSSAKVAVLLCSIVLATGMIWGKCAWGTWWEWRSPRLTFSLLLWLLFVVYLILRASIDSEQRRAAVAAVYGVVAFLDVPLVYLSVKLLGDPQHPDSVSLAPAMKWTLIHWLFTMTLICGALIHAGYLAQARARARREELAVGAPQAMNLSLLGGRS